MFGKRKATAENLTALQKKVTELLMLGTKVKSIEADYETLARRIRELSTGSGMETLVREAVSKIDLELLRKGIVAELKDQLKPIVKEDIEGFLRDHDFSEDVRIDEDRVCELVAGKLASGLKDSITKETLVKEIAQQLIDGESLSFEDIENSLGESIAERVTVSLKPVSS